MNKIKKFLIKSYVATSLFAFTYVGIDIYSNRSPTIDVTFKQKSFEIKLGHRNYQNQLNYRNNNLNNLTNKELIDELYERWPKMSPMDKIYAVNKVHKLIKESDLEKIINKKGRQTEQLLEKNR